MRKPKIFIATIALSLFSMVSVQAEDVLKWELLENLPDGRSYNYSPTSLRTVEGSIREVYDGVASAERKDVRQLRIDCDQQKWAIGETKSWRGEELVPSPNFSEGGWAWIPIGESLSGKLLSIVCPEQSSK